MPVIAGIHWSASNRAACSWRYVCGTDHPDLDWWDVVQPYTRSNGILMCPSTPNDLSAGQYPGTPGLQNLGIGLNVYPDPWASGLTVPPEMKTPWGGYIYAGTKLAAASIMSSRVNSTGFLRYRQIDWTVSSRSRQSLARGLRELP